MNRIIAMSKGIKLNKRTVVYSLIVVTILFLSVGFSAFQNNLQIEDLAASVRIEKDIRISNIKIDSVNNGVSSYEDYNVSNITSKVILEQEDSYIIYDVDIYNLGNVEMGIKSISINNENLKAEFIDYNLKDKICENDKCILGVRKTIKLKISYKDNKYDAENTEQEFCLNFSFKQVYDVKYSGVENTDNLQYTVLETDTLTVDLSEESNDILVVKINDNITNNYTYQNGILTIKNISGNVSISLSTTSIMEDKIISNYVSSGKIDDVTSFDFDTMTQEEKTNAFSSPTYTTGIYKVKGITGKKDVIVFRGAVINNFVSLGGMLWKIVQVDENGNLRLISDEVISTSKYNDNIIVSDLESAKNALSYENSDVKKTLDKWYETLSDYKDKIVVTKFCNDFTNKIYTSPETSNETNYFQSYLNVGTAAANYTPSLICPSDSIFTDNIGLLSAEEFVLAGGALNHTTEFFYLHNPAVTDTWWTLSPAYYDSTSNNADVFTVTSDSALKDLNSSLLKAEYGLRPVITINGNYEMDGNGTKSNPYTFKDEKTEEISFKTGDKIELGDDQTFYVISSNANSTQLLAAYNLNVGDYKNSDVTEGIQASSIRAWVGSDIPNYGRTKYYDTQGDSTSGTTELTNYLNNYMTYVEKNYNIEISSIDLLKRSDAIKYLGMNASGTGFDSSSSYYSWMTYTTFWFKEEKGMNGSVYYLNTGNLVATANDVSGIRPLLVIDTKKLEDYINKSSS